MERGVQNEIEVEFALQHFYYNYPSERKSPKKDANNVEREGRSCRQEAGGWSEVQAPSKGCARLSCLRGIVQLLLKGLQEDLAAV